MFETRGDDNRKGEPMKLYQKSKFLFSGYLMCELVWSLLTTLIFIVKVARSLVLSMNNLRGDNLDFSVLRVIIHRFEKRTQLQSPFNKL